MANRDLSRRQFLIGASALAAGTALAACAPSAPTAAPATQAPAATEAPVATVPPATAAPSQPEGAVVRFWVGWGGETWATAWKAIEQSDDFKQALGNNTFEVKDSVNGEVMLAATASGDPPEAGSNIQYIDFMARGVLVPIDEMVAASPLKKEDFLEGNWDQAFYKGVMYGVPAIEGFVRFGLNYNTKLVQEAGLDPQKPPVTWDEVYAWHEKLTKKDDAGNLLRVGLNPFGAMGEGLWYPDGWMVPTSWGWNWFDDEKHTFDLNNDKMVEALTTFKRFVDLVGADNLTGLYSVEGRDTWGGAYNAEAEAMIIEGYWHPGETANQAPEVAKYNRATWLPVPENRRGVKAQNGGSHLVVLFKGAKSIQTMFNIAVILDNKPACDAFFKNLGWLPSVKAYYAGVDPNTYPGLDFYMRSVQETTEWHRAALCEITNFISTEYLSLKDKVNRSEMTPKDAAAELQKRCEEEYKAQGFGS